MAVADKAPHDMLVQALALLHEFWARVDRIVDHPAADLFTPDGEMLLGALQKRGRGALLDYFAERSKREREQGRYTRHIMANPWIVGGDAGQCDVRSLIIVHAGIGTLPLPSQAPSTIADFTYRLVATPQGWRIDRMESDPIFLGAGALATTQQATVNVADAAA